MTLWWRLWDWTVRKVTGRRRYDPLAWRQERHDRLHHEYSLWRAGMRETEPTWEEIDGEVQGHRDRLR